MGGSSRRTFQCLSVPFSAFQCSKREALCQESRRVDPAGSRASFVATQCIQQTEPGLQKNSSLEQLSLDTASLATWSLSEVFHV